MTINAELRNHVDMAIRNPSDRHVCVSTSSHARHVAGRNGGIKERAFSVISQDRVESEVASIEMPDSIADSDVIEQADESVDFYAIASQELQVIRKALAVCERIAAKLAAEQ